MLKKLILCIVATIILTSCERIENIESDINNLQNRLDSLELRVSNLESAVEIFEELHANGALINDIKPSDKDAGSWVITLSDGRILQVYNGDAQSHTPYLKIDQDGYWCLSYDNGATFTRILDNNGEYVKAPVAMYVSTDEDGYYVFVIHYANNPENIIDVIKTPHTSDPSKIIHSITQSDTDLSITITMADGSSFTFNKEYIMPTAIAILSTRPIVLASGTTASIEFRINPSNALFNYDTTSDSCQIVLDCIYSTRSAGSYVTPPTNYKLKAVEQVYDEQGTMKEGQYRAYITDLNVSTLYDEDVALVVTTKNATGSTVQISSSAFSIKYSGNIFTHFSFLSKNNPTLPEDIHLPIESQNYCEYITPYPIDLNNLVATFETNGEKVLANNIEQISEITSVDFTQPVTYTIISATGETNKYTIHIAKSGLPILYINTPNEATIPSKHQDWLEGCEMCLYNSDSSIDFEGTTNIRGRGNSTWNFAKKPYALKLESKTSILGMPKHKRWVLLANYIDRTLLRNHIAFGIAKLTDLDWTPRGEYVELVLNGKHQGNYYLCEQIKIDKNRVNICEMESSDTIGEAITGGYLLELDQYFDEVNRFRSKIWQLPYMFKEPDEDVLVTEQFDYIQNYINELENELRKNFTARKWASKIDFTTFIDWWFVHELSNNSEPSHPKSSYMYKDRNDVLKAGPVWDFDWGTFTPDYSAQYSCMSAIYYQALFNDREFVTLLKERWALLKPQFETIPATIRKESDRLQVSNKINIAMWPISERINNDETLTYSEAIERMIEAYNLKLQWLDEAINKL